MLPFGGSFISSDNKTNSELSGAQGPGILIPPHYIYIQSSVSRHNVESKCITLTDVKSENRYCGHVKLLLRFPVETHHD